MNIRNDVAGYGSAKRVYGGAEGRLPSPAGLRNQGQVQQGQPGRKGISKHTVTYVTFPMTQYTIHEYKTSNNVSEFTHSNCITLSYYSSPNTRV